MSMFPSLMRSFMNLLVRSNSISWHCSRSLKSGLSRKESLNSSVGRPIARLIHAANYERTTARRLLCLLGETPNGVSVCSEQISQKFPPATLFHAFLTFSQQNFRTQEHNRVSDREGLAKLYNELHAASLQPSYCRYFHIRRRADFLFTY